MQNACGIDSEITKILSYFQSQDVMKIDKNDLTMFIRHFESKIKTQHLVAKNKEQDQVQKTIMLIQESKLEKLIRIFRDIEISNLKKQMTVKKQEYEQAQRQKQASQNRIIRQSYQQMNEIEESKEQGKYDPEREEYEKEGQQILMNLQSDINQIEDTEKIIFELSNLLQQFSTKVVEQENMSVLNEGNQELKKAHEYQKGNGHLFAAIFIIYTLMIIIWDWFNTKYY
ncbi:UNKNOWN [Stylonychia lemnae]|uniref:t-SNARE coiled-coil homology domain-containing protein n=1 Tax=Stylonychia lemnae TaxID=5949 RepID=A0A078AFQ9_STYLE|nr:UNKNOWN [Stylonychia lemnae]|eukprot:CDW81069.1 UNKNOWN [Stylonychia lemnae]